MAGTAVSLQLKHMPFWIAIDAVPGAHLLVIRPLVHGPRHRVHPALLEPQQKLFLFSTALTNRNKSALYYISNKFSTARHWNVPSRHLGQEKLRKRPTRSGRREGIRQLGSTCPPTRSLVSSCKSCCRREFPCSSQTSNLAPQSPICQKEDICDEGMLQGVNKGMRRRAAAAVRGVQ